LSTSPSNASGSSTKAPDAGRVLVFTGHRIDAPGRERPRFPAEQEGAARQRIREAVEAEVRSGESVAFGIAGGASGGDILFHEVCAELGVPTRLYLALEPGPYVEASVSDAGHEWVERFRRLHARLSEKGAVHVFCDVDEDSDETIWQRTNLWMLRDALATAGEDGRVTLIALWDKEPTGDGLGGTSDLVQRAARRGARTVVIDTKALFGL
jgi:hypothetical protein